VKFFDAHIHLEKLDEMEAEWRALPSEMGTGLAASASAPGDCERLLALRRNCPGLFCAFGVHPWSADRRSFEELAPFLPFADAVGEIGMDSVWCGVDLGLQRRVFMKQLEWAEANGRPAVLHTKGCEEEIARRIRYFSGPFLVHWYSCEILFEAFLDKDCYFTIGPDLGLNPAVAAMVRRVPADRLMVESDGLSAIAWATGRNAAPADIPGILWGSLYRAAELKGMTPDALRKQTTENARRFYGARGK
jgi:TatD DNase family protein